MEKLADSLYAYDYATTRQKGVFVLAAHVVFGASVDATLADINTITNTAVERVRRRSSDPYCRGISKKRL